MEKKKFRDAEAAKKQKLEQQKNLLFGVEYIDDGGIGLANRRKDDGIFAPLIKSYNDCVKRLICEKTMRRIRLRFDKSTASFFTTFYFIVKYAGFFILLFTPFMII